MSLYTSEQMIKHAQPFEWYQAKEQKLKHLLKTYSIVAICTVVYIANERGGFDLELVSIEIGVSLYHHRNDRREKGIHANVKYMLYSTRTSD